METQCDPILDNVPRSHQSFIGTCICLNEYRNMDSMFNHLRSSHHQFYSKHQPHIYCMFKIGKSSNSNQISLILTEDYVSDGLNVFKVFKGKFPSEAKFKIFKEAKLLFNNTPKQFNQTCIAPNPERFVSFQPPLNATVSSHRGNILVEESNINNPSNVQITTTQNSKTLTNNDKTNSSQSICQLGASTYQIYRSVFNSYTAIAQNYETALNEYQKIFFGKRFQTWRQESHGKAVFQHGIDWAI